jgi:biotin-[acetyl-CoA-carboxylase] ligase BirA-like protein
MDFVSFAEQLVRHRPRRTGGLIVVEKVDSTQHLGRRLIEEYSRDGSLCPSSDLFAWRQSAGRGRQGRSWSSPPGQGVYGTLIRCVGSSDGVQTLPLRIATAACTAVNRYLDGSCRLKWPNDLLVGQGKLGGILIEAISQDGQETIAAIGIGVNYGGELAAFGEPGATSLLHETDSVPALAAFALELVEAIDDELDRVASTAEIVERYGQLSSHKTGETMRVRIDEDLVEGRFLGFDDNAFLRLEVDGKERHLSTGEVLAGG